MLAQVLSAALCVFVDKAQPLPCIGAPWSREPALSLRDLDILEA